MYAASTQNSGGGAPYLNVLVYAYMFPGRAPQDHFLYSPESQRILRDPLEKRHGLKLFCGTEHTSMSAKVFDALGGALQDAVMESAYLAQVHVQAANEAALVKTVGFSDPQSPDTIFVKEGAFPAYLPEDQVRMAEEICSPEFNPKPWAQWRERLNNWAGGIDTCQEIYDVARQIPKDTLPENVEPVQFAVIFLVGASIGFITPPFGLKLYVASAVTGVPYFRLLRSTVPYLAARIAVWIIVALVPLLSSALLPNR